MKNLLLKLLERLFPKLYQLKGLLMGLCPETQGRQSLLARVSFGKTGKILHQWGRRLQSGGTCHSDFVCGHISRDDRWNGDPCGCACPDRSSQGNKRVRGANRSPLNVPVDGSNSVRK